jgi:hypothetical protein
MRAASGALLAAAMFFTGVLVGGRGIAEEGPPPSPVALVAAELPSPVSAPTQRPLELVEVPRHVEEDPIEEYEDDEADSSGPGPGGGGGGDDSGPGSDDSGPGSDDSGSGSDDSGSGSPGSGSSGSGSSGSGSSGSSGSGSDSSGPGS